MKEEISRLSIRQIENILSSDVSEAFLQACAQDSRLGVQRLAERYEKNRIQKITENERIEQMLVEEKKLWSNGYLYVAGIDEVGRGPLAGPVMAAACVLPAKFYLPGLNDSKQLTKNKREKLYWAIREQALSFSVGSAESAEIDTFNILEASKLAMKRAIQGLTLRPHYLLIDALELDNMTIPQKGIQGGDASSASIAAASILAKVTRDQLMEDLHKIYPMYGFDRNKGYGTKEHLEALRLYGPSPVHRRSFAPVRNSEDNNAV